MIYDCIVGILVCWEDKGIVGDPVLEIGEPDGDGKDEELDAETFRIACLCVDKTTAFLDALHAFLGLDGNHILTFFFFGGIGVVVDVKGKLGGIFVAIFVVNAENLDFAFVALNTGIGSSVVPCGIFVIDKLAIALLEPDGALGLVKANDIDGIMKRTAFVAKDHLIFLLEKLAGLFRGEGALSNC